MDQFLNIDAFVKLYIPWTTRPNNVPDEQHDNDTVVHSTQTAMEGTYTIGGVSPDFATFTDATNALVTYGVCASVTFNVRGGKYTERIDIQNLVGTSSTNTITFQPDPNNTNLVEVEFNATQSSEDGVILIVNSSFITFDGINVETLNSGGLATVIWTKGGSDLTFKNLTTTCTASANDFNVYVEQTENITFDNVELIEGYYGFYLYGNSQAYPKGLTVTNCSVSDVYYYGIFTQYYDDINISGNKVDMNDPSTSYFYNRSIYVYSYNGNNVTVSDNYTEDLGYGVYLYLGGSKNVGDIRVVNNKIRVGDTTNTTNAYAYYGLYYYGGFGTVAHNTILREKNFSSGGYTCYINGGLNEFYNNLIMTVGSGASIQVNGSFAITEADYNAYANYTSSNGTPSGGLSTMTGNGYGANSLAFSSEIFTSLDSLYTCFDSLVGMGTYMMDIPNDIDGIARNTAAPTIGASEYTTPDAFSLGDDFNLCSGDTTYIGQEVNGATFTWNTGDTTGVLMVTTPGSYNVTMKGGCGDANGSVVVSAGEAIPTFSNSRSWLTAVFTNTSANATSYMWDFDDGSTSTDEHPVHLFPSTGVYNVCLTATGECGDETTCQSVEVSDYVGITENALSDAVSIYPNPATDVLTINVDNVIGDELNIELSNIAGQVVVTRSLSEFNGTAKEDIDVNDLTEGVYFVKVYTNEATTTVRVVVQK